MGPISAKFESDPPGADVRVNGEYQGTTPTTDIRQREGKLVQVWIVLREAKALTAVEPQYRPLAFDQPDQNIPELSIAQPISRLRSAPLLEQLRKAADTARNEFQRHLLHVPEAVSD